MTRRYWSKIHESRGIGSGTKTSKLERGQAGWPQTENVQLSDLQESARVHRWFSKVLLGRDPR